MTFYGLVLYHHLIFVRDRVALGLILLPFAIVIFSWFLGSTVIFEQTDAIFSFARFSLRYTYLLTTIFFLISFWHDFLKSDDWLIFRASALSDTELIVAGWLSVLEISFIFSLPLFLSLTFLGGYEGLLSAIKIFAECLTLSTLSYCLMLSKVSRILCISLTFGFYLLAHFMGVYKNLSFSPFVEQKVAFLGRFIMLITACIPQLDHLWSQNVILFVLKTVLFSILLLGVLRTSWQR